MKKLKKVFTVIIAMSMGICSLTACGKEETTEAPSTEEETTEGSAAEDETAGDTATAEDAGAEVDLASLGLMNDGVLTVGCEVGYPPFEDFAEDGTTPIGYDVDIITEAASRLGLEVNIINTAWDGIFAGLGVNYDVVCSACTITDDRKETMDFTTPYINNYQAVVIPTGSSLAINSFNDLDGLTVGVQKETTSDILMSDYKSTGTIDIEIVANEKVTSCFTQLTNGEIDAISVDSTVADGYIAKEPEKYTIAYLDEAEAEQFGIAVTKGNEALVEALNGVLAEMEEDGFIEDTYDYWFGSGAAE